MRPRYTNVELAQLYDKKDWAILWPVVTSMVKHAVRRCMQHGFDPFYVHDDLMQEAYLAAWEALPRWNAFEGSLQTWVSEKVRSAVLNANTRAATGMIGGRDSGELVVTMHGEIAEGDGGNDEQGMMQGHEARIMYDDPPEGFDDPARESEEEDWLSMVPVRDRDMVRRLCGIGVPAETQEEYSRAAGVSRRTVVGRIEALRNYFCALSRKPVNHGVKAA